MEQLRYQSYAPQPTIDGVVHKPLQKHRSLEGSFMEHLRLRHGKVEGFDFELQQTGVTVAVPHRINAFHIHPKVPQHEIWCALQGTFLVWLVDLRDDSRTKRSYVLSGEQPALLLIPTGVAHGYQTGAEGGILLYAMSSQFNIDDPNEGRLPWNMFGEDLWDANRG